MASFTEDTWELSMQLSDIVKASAALGSNRALPQRGN